MAENTDNFKLVVSLEARLRSYEKAIAHAQKQTNDRMRGIETALKRPQQEMDRVGQAAQRMEARLGKVGGALKSFSAGLLGGVAAGGVAGIATAIVRVADGMARIGDEAARAGLSTKAFQELKYVAEQNRIGVDALVDGIKELNLRADEFITTGKGSAAEAFARLGLSAEELRDKLRDPSALFTEIIGKLGKLDRAAAIRIADEIFGGTGGEKFVQLIAQGEAGIRDQIRAANDLGIVLDDELIKRADELDRKFNQIASTVGTALKSAIVEAAGALQSFIDRFRQVDARQTETLQAQLSEAERNLNAAQNGKGRLGGAGGLIFDRQIETSQGEVDRLRQVLRDRALQTIKPQLETLGGGVAAKTDRLGYTPSAPSTGSGRDAGASAAEREADAVRRLIGELEEELRLVSASDTEKQIAAALRRANVDAASAEGKQIAGLVRQIEAETAALDANRQAQEDRVEALSGLFEVGGEAILSIADGSMKAEDALKRLVTQLALAAAQAALLGTGPLSGLFGGGGIFGKLVGGGGGSAAVSGGKLLQDVFDYHSGGTAGSGTRGRSVSPAAFIDAPRFHNGTLGLRSNELAAVLERGEEVLTARQAANAANIVGGLSSRVSSGSGGAGGGVVEVRLGRDLEARILDRAGSQSVQIVQQGITEYDQAMPSRVNSIARDPWAR